MDMGSIVSVGKVGQGNERVSWLSSSVPAVSTAASHGYCFMGSISESCAMDKREPKDSGSSGHHIPVGALGIDPRQLARSIKTATDDPSSRILGRVYIGFLALCAITLAGSTAWNVHLNQQQLKLQQEVRDRIKTLESKIDQVEVLRQELRERLGMISRMNDKQDT
jgi:hypothetical protein